jgi:hypothetical protein
VNVAFRLWRAAKAIIPVYAWWAVARIVFAVGLVSRFSSGVSRGTPLNGRTTLCIQAGAGGWNSLEFKEIFASAQELLGAERALKHIVDRDSSYIRQFVALCRLRRFTHFLYDPRTGSQHWWGGVLEAFVVLGSLTARRIEPIVYVTDISLRRHRIQAAIVSAGTGACVTFMDRGFVQLMFPHKRIVGPSLMPISKGTLDELQARKLAAPACAGGARFVGSMYEPRESLLQQIQSGLRDEGIHFEIKGRAPGSQRITDFEYWEELLGTEIVVTTSAQVQADGMDYREVNQLVYRVTESLAAGTALVVEEAPGLTNFFTPGEHLEVFSSARDAVRIVRNLALNPTRKEALRLAGQKRLRMLLADHGFWKRVDDVLQVPLQG